MLKAMIHSASSYSTYAGEDRSLARYIGDHKLFKTPPPPHIRRSFATLMKGPRFPCRGGFVTQFPHMMNGRNDLPRSSSVFELVMP